ncbi:DUF1156 domain-containing protein [Schaalia sp. ZJ405]|uniref:DUF1156 domain-containing protein n=1 Tax=Schaalia sp. ZJ405 TaxID=2709403 RepID=UPI0013EA0185|nr:DUF1156 domain-containing protein [Schaalia sp. ZJ405]QPK81225.1 DUF1156 domain-containing protein [Schaalia sp. ZJ405]
MTTASKKKLIEVSIPLDAINEASAREKSIRHGHPSTLHLYWSRKPLSTSRAVLFAQLVDDPSSRPEEFPTTEDQDRERARLHDLMKRMVIWENSNDPVILAEARREILKSTGETVPSVLDPFTGGGSIPLEAQRLGLHAEGSDLNPLAVLISKALIELPPPLAGNAPVFPESKLQGANWPKASGLAEDIRRYGRWMRDEAYRRIGHLYPTVTDSSGTERTVIAWKWARTVINPNPANPIEVPLVSSWWLSKKKGKEAWVEAQVVNGQIQYTVRNNAEGPTGDAEGTINRRGAVSIADGTPIPFTYIRSEGKAGRMGAHLIAIVAEGTRGRVYISPNSTHFNTAEILRPTEIPDSSLARNPRDFKTPNYGLTTFADLFTDRQLVALTTLSDLVSETREKIFHDALAAGMSAGERLEDGGIGAHAYADTVATYLALAVSRTTDYSSNLCSWHAGRDTLRNVFGRQAIPMVWDFAETNLFSRSSGNFYGQITWVAKVVDNLPASPRGLVTQADAATRDYSDVVISTDPPYYDNIGYSDLSDFFYVWLRRSLRNILPSTVSTMLTPKAEELVANPYRHDGKDGAAEFFIDGFNSVFARIRGQANREIPMTVYYAYKQQDTRDSGTASTGWHTLLDGLIAAGWEVTATWPMRSELTNRMLARGTNALASSIVLACRPRSQDARIISKSQFVSQLKSELPEALRTMLQGNVQPVDLAQAAIGPGISVFSRYSRVRDAAGNTMSVKDALMLINHTLDEVLGEQESDFDPETRFAIKWYRQNGWSSDNSGLADQLARSSDTSLGALERGGILEAAAGKTRLLSPTELNGMWQIERDEHVSIWEAVIRLAALLKHHGTETVAELLPRVRQRVSVDAVKELGFLLFHEAEKKGDGEDALLFNSLISSWGDLQRQSHSYSAEFPETQSSLEI